MRKQVVLDKRAAKELQKFSRAVQLKFQALIEILEQEGALKEPFAKKIGGKVQLFELRIRHQGQYRMLYTYFGNAIILLLIAFQKKTQKTPISFIRTAGDRIAEYTKE